MPTVNITCSWVLTRLQNKFSLIENQSAAELAIVPLLGCNESHSTAKFGLYLKYALAYGMFFTYDKNYLLILAVSALLLSSA